MRKSMSLSWLFSLVVLLLGTSGIVLAQQDATPTQQPDDKSTTAAPDNTGKNQRDRNSSEPTADQQKENETDRELARQIRRALMKDKSLSTYGHNVKVIAQNGVVTLKGPVNSDEEKRAIESKAAEVAGGAEKVRSEIEVSGADKKASPSKNDYSQ
jgi:hyperosmotically inducible periplasmic protein